MKNFNNQENTRELGLMIEKKPTTLIKEAVWYQLKIKADD